MRKNTILIALMACAMVMMGSCSKKVTQQVTSVNQPVLPVEQGTTASPQVAKVENYYQADWNTFKSGGNASVGGTGKEMSSSMQMRMHRGKSIYVSLRPVLGIEVAKMVISGDSILLVDKVHKRYVLEKASLLTNGVPVTVSNLQDIFLGRAFELGKGSLTQELKNDFVTEIVDGKVMLRPVEQYNGFSYSFSYDKLNNIISLDVSPAKQGASTYSVKYGDIEGTVAGKVASKVNVATTINGKAFTLNMEYKDIKFNEAFTIDTSTPSSKYKRMAAKDILQLFSGGK